MRTTKNGTVEIVIGLVDGGVLYLRCKFTCIILEQLGLASSTLSVLCDVADYTNMMFSLSSNCSTTLYGVRVIWPLVISIVEPLCTRSAWEPNEDEGLPYSGRCTGGHACRA